MRYPAPVQLPQLTPLYPDELPISFIARLAWKNGFSSLRQFCRVTNLQLPDIHRMNKSVAQRVSEMSGVPLNEIVRFSKPNLPIIEYGCSSVRARDVLRLGTIRICRHCLSDNGSATPLVDKNYIRAPWQWNVIATCGTHGCRLTELKQPFLDLSDFRMSLVPDDAESEQSSRSVDTYLYNRLSEPSGHSLLDRMPAFVAAEFCIVLGLIKANHNRTRSTYLQSGFEIAAMGEEAVSSLLVDVADGSNKDGRYLAPLLEWAASHSGMEHYRSAFDFLQRHCRQFVRFYVGDYLALPLVLDALDYMSLAEAAVTLGCSKADIGELAKVGTLQVFNDPLGPRASPLYLDRREVESLARDVETLARANKHTTEMVRLSDAIASTSIKFSDILLSILSGDIRAALNDGSAFSISALYVDLIKQPSPDDELH